MNRRKFLKTTTAGVAGALFGSSFMKQCSSAPAQPNIIYILADDLGYGNLGCYGQTEIQTPNLDRMASEGMRFTDHYAGSTVCAPSRCMLMTGNHPGHARIRGNGRVPLQPEDITVANILKDSGYATGCIGKWGLGEANSTGTPNNQGFDYFYGYLNQIRAHNYYPTFLWENQNKVQLDNETVIAETGYSEGIGSASTNKEQYSHDLFAEKALSYIDDHAGSPFFLYLPFTIPHANNEHWLIDHHGMEVPDYGIYADRDWREKEKGFAAMVTRMDRDIGRILDKLQELGIDENTVVMFSSDNGPHAEGTHDPDFFNDNGPLRGMKRDLYEGGIRVPMIVRWPGQIAPGSESDHPSAFWDILPTCAELAGAGSPDNIDGISFVPELLGRNQPEHEYLYWEFPAQGGKQAVRMGNWKGVRLNVAEEGREAPIELYNLSEDIGEENNIADDNPDVVEQIAGIMEQAHIPSEDFPLFPDEIT